jgi:hypothetical protein
MQFMFSSLKWCTTLKIRFQQEMIVEKVFEALPAVLSSSDETLPKFTGKPPTNID